MRLLLLALSVIVLGGCAHVQPAHTAGCAFVAYPLQVSDTRGLQPTDFEAVLARAMTEPPEKRNIPGQQPPSALILSGGSQHGAFGAGFFAGMPSVPEYKVVTAISTGALQSTFLFLANQPVPPDRRYAPYMGPPSPGQHSNVGDLALAYSISKEGDLLDVGSFGQFGGVVRGSVAKFGPLRATLTGLLSEETLKQVGAAYDPDEQKGRRLLVGVADVNDGNGYAIDLTELANRLFRGKQDFASVQACYIDALIASSSVPLAVPPVTLDVRVAPESNETRQHMYIDGGARFGVFWKQLGAFAAGPGPEFTLIVNGRLYGKPWVKKDGKPRNSWSSITLGLRAVDILENQVYRFSVDNVQRLGGGNGRINMAFISDQGLGPGWGSPDDYRYDGKSCAEWSDVDSKTKPTEFHAHYMRCLLEYGRARGKAMAWNKLEQ